MDVEQKSRFTIDDGWTLGWGFIWAQVAFTLIVGIVVGIIMVVLPNVNLTLGSFSGGK